MEAIRAIYDGFSFMPQQPIPVKGKYEVVITFIVPINEEITNKNESNKLPRSTAKGLLTGKVYMADNFNEPIDEFR